MAGDNEKPPKSKFSPSKSLLAWGGLAVGVAGALASIGVLHYQKADDVTPYQLQVHAACNRLQQIHTSASQGLSLGVSMMFPRSWFQYTAPTPVEMPTYAINKAVLMQGLQSDYDATKLEFELLDQRTTPTALKSVKQREESAKGNYLSFELTLIQKAQRTLPDPAPVEQMTAVGLLDLPVLGGTSSAAEVELDDTLSALAGGNCTTTAPVARTSPKP
jgi:hypothetical protein